MSYTDLHAGNVRLQYRNTILDVLVSKRHSSKDINANVLSTREGYMPMLGLQITTALLYHSSSNNDLRRRKI